jgi:hypothetical protein
MRRQPGRPGTWQTGLLVTAALLALALFAVACGPEASRTRDGGTGGSSRPAPAPTRVSAPELVVPPTANIPYATDGPMPTLPPAAAPAGSPAASPGFAVPTNAVPGTFAVPTPGATPTR